MKMYCEYIGVDTEIYSVFHCELYTITITQDGQGLVQEITVDTTEMVDIEFTPKDSVPFLE